MCENTVGKYRDGIHVREIFKLLCKSKTNFKNPNHYTLKEQEKMTWDDAKAIATHIEKDKWISVEDRLPSKAGEEFLGVNMNQGGVMSLIYWSKVYKYFKSKGDIILSLQITHWMPLPEPPREDKPNGKT